MATTQATGDCFSEIHKYDWDINEAKAILSEENRSNNPASVNDNPATGDYSVGCWQINLIGEMRYSRPDEQWLKNAANNTQYAYKMYVDQGRTFCKTSGWYNSCKKAGLLANR